MYNSPYLNCTLNSAAEVSHASLAQWGTALYFYQSRWYDPVIGRFLAADTIVL